MVRCLIIIETGYPGAITSLKPPQRYYENMYHRHQRQSLKFQRSRTLLTTNEKILRYECGTLFFFEAEMAFMYFQLVEWLVAVPGLTLGNKNLNWNHCIQLVSFSNSHANFLIHVLKFFEKGKILWTKLISDVHPILPRKVPLWFL